MPARRIKQRPPRLGIVFQREHAPLYLITFNTLFRQRILAQPAVHDSFRHYAQRGVERGAAVGRYVIMPDHVHLFVRMGGDVRLTDWVRLLKQCLGKALQSVGLQPVRMAGMTLRSFWQPGFFDHLLRRDESYREKWDYVWRNPVRAGLVARAEEWPYQGEIVVIDRV
jgi:putative transposase